MKRILRLSNKKKKRKHRWFRRAFCAAFVCAGFAFVSVMVLRSRGLLFDDSPRLNDYPCRGAYISESCGEINWNSFKREKLDFCYIRATMGSAFTDRYFEYNKREAEKTGWLVGFVHDFDFGAEGELQAKNFISAASGFSGRLMPVLDIRMNAFERLKYGKDQYAVRINAFKQYLTHNCGCSVILLCDSGSRDELELDKTTALLWTDGMSKNDEGNVALQTYSKYGSVRSNSGSSKHFDALCTEKGMTSDEFTKKYIVE